MVLDALSYYLRLILKHSDTKLNVLTNVLRKAKEGLL